MNRKAGFESKKNMIVILIVCFVTFIGLDAKSQWLQTNGPVGGTVACLVTDGTSLYAGTQGSGVFYSANSGTSWTQKISGLSTNNINALAMNGTTVYAGGNGLFTSSNYGTTWTNLNNGISGTENIMSLAVSGSNIFVGTNGNGIYRSTNGGASFAPSNTGLPASCQVTSLLINGSNIFAGLGLNGIYLSTNNGATWTAVNTGLTGIGSGAIHSIVAKGSNLFASVHANGAFLSTNNGTSWSPVSTGLPNLFVNSFAVNGTDLFAAMDNNGVYKSTDDGSTWTAANGGIANTRVFAISVMGANIFAGSNGTAVYLTTNNGATWSPSNVGFIATDVHAMAFNGTNLFAGGYGTGMFLSSSGGTSWSSLTNPLIFSNYTSLAVSSSGNIFASTYGEGNYLSTNNGATWTAINSTLATTGSAMYQRCLLTTTGSNVFTGSVVDGVFFSTNNGTSWTQKNTGLTNLDITAMAVNGVNVFAGTNGGGVFLSTNNGTTWSAVNTGLSNLFISSLIVNGTNIFAGTMGGGVFLSTNNGATWTAVNTGLLMGYTYESFAASGTDLFVTCYGNVFYTNNNGTTWSNVSSGLPTISFKSLAINGTTLYVGGGGQGVWKREIPELICSLNPPIMSSSAATSICSGSTVSIPLTNTGVAATYSWVAIDNSQTTGESTTIQTTGTLSNSITNLSNSTSANVIYTVTPIGIIGGCSGTPQTVTVTVNPRPVMTSNSTLTICSGQPVGLSLTGSAPSTFSWSAINNANTTGESTTLQTGTTINDILVNTSLVPQTVIYTITPTSTTGICSGTAQTVTVIVNPTPTMTSVSTASICSGETVNINLTSNVAASYVWIATNNANTTGESTTFQSTGTLSNTVVNNTTSNQIVTYTVTPTAIVGGCTGSQTFTLTVKPAPNMTSVSTASICSGTNVSITLTSDIPSSYSWNASSDNPNTIGESISPQSTAILTNTIVNNSTIAQIVYYSVTPTSTAGACVGTTQSVTVTVKPVPTMSNSSSATICSAGVVSIPLSSDVASSYTWIAADNINTTGESITLQASNVLSNTISNSSIVTQNVLYSVTPTATIGGCVGPVQTITVTVNPTPVMTSAATATICSGTTVNIPLTGNVVSSFVWNAANNVNTTGEYTSSQFSSVLNNTISNNSSLPQNVVFTVTPTSVAGSCVGMSQTVTVTVNPEPLMISSPSAVICSGGIVSIPLISSVASTFSWIAANNPNTTGESLTAQSTSTLSNTISNGTAFVQNVVYSVTPTSTIGACIGGTQTVSVLVNPIDDASFSYPSSSYCVTGSNPSAIITGVSGGTFSSSSGLIFANIYTGLINLSASTVGTYLVTYTTSGSCANSSTFTITITAAPSAVFTYSNTNYCSDALNPMPNFVSGASAGTFSANPTGISFVSTLTGEIDLSSSIPGTYLVTNNIVASGGCASDASTFTITINSIPVVSYSGLASTYYYNEPSVTLTGSPLGGIFSGTAISGNAFDPTVAGPGTFSILYTYTDVNGCTNSSNQATTVLMQPAPPSICEVTVDDNGVNNEIYWDKTLYTNVDSFIVYRETGLGYQRIGAQIDTAMSLFTDTVRTLYFPNTGDPNAGTYRYKLQIRDINGNYSPLSPYHNTIYISKSFGTFSWNHYQIEGETVPLPSSTLITYDLWRDDYSTGVWHQVNSVTGSQVTQTDVGWNALLDSTASWRILTNWTIGCTPTRAGISTSRSNIRNKSLLGGSTGLGSEELNTSIFVFPNPANEYVDIDVTNKGNQPMKIQLYNAVGKMVYQTETTNALSRIQVSTFAKGIYTVCLFVNGHKITKKMVIN